MVPCKVCGASMAPVFKGLVLQKHEVQYFQCGNCGLLRTQDPFWLDEAYSDPISKFDVGLVQRNIDLAKTISRLLKRHFDSTDKFLDYAGGYGLFTRLMRDRGFDFYSMDRWSQNIFAGCFEAPPLTSGESYEAVTALEFLEHVEAPLEEFSTLFTITDSVVFTTAILPKNVRRVDDWWYLAPETGQHITFYSLDSLERIAGEMDAELYTNGSYLHLLTRRSMSGVCLAEGKINISQRMAVKIANMLYAVAQIEHEEAPVDMNNIWSDYKLIKSGREIIGAAGCDDADTNRKKND